MEDGISLAVGGTAVGALATLGCTWIRARFSKTRIEPDPLHVETTKNGPYVTTGECKQHRCALRDRLDEQREGFRAVIAKLEENDKKSEDRSSKMHERIDPLIKEVARTSEAVKFLKAERGIQ